MTKLDLKSQVEKGEEKQVEYVMVVFIMNFLTVIVPA